MTGARGRVLRRHRCHPVFMSGLVYRPATVWTATAGSAGDESSKTLPPDEETAPGPKLTGELKGVQRPHQMWGQRPDMIVRARVPFNAGPPSPAFADGEMTRP